jgi:hypothetical protein
MEYREDVMSLLSEAENAQIVKTDIEQPFDEENGQRKNPFND